jgi:DnaJ-class molecular chaperone
MKYECDECFGYGYMWESYFGIDKVICTKCNGNGYIEDIKENQIERLEQLILI